MLFDSTLRKDLSRSFGATLTVLLTIVLTMALIRMLGQAAQGRVSPQDVVLLLGYTALGQLPTMLALSMFIAVVASLSRMYRDSEMAVWFASGVGLARFVRPVLRTAAPVLVVVSLLVLVVWPWVNRQGADLRDRFDRRGDLSRVTPGQFQTSSDGQRVFFIERDPGDAGSARNVFILSQRDGTESVTTARTGRIQYDGGDRWLVLDQGQRNDVAPAGGERTLSRFDSYRVIAGDRVRAGSVDLLPKMRPSLELLREPTRLNQAELTWRLGIALGGANLLLLGIGLSATNPRRASSWNLLFALLGFVVYYNVINLTQAWVAGGKLGMGSALGLAHGGAFLIAVLLLGWRDQRNRWRRRVPGGAVTGSRAPMKTVRRLFYVDILSSVAFVSVAFLSLFFFIDFVDALSDAARRGSGSLYAAASSLLEVPGHLYELAPIAVLIGTIYALSRMAQSSEFTILRTGGLGPGRALSLLAVLGVGFAVLTLLIGDYAAPVAEREAVRLKALSRGNLLAGASGAWLKDRQSGADGERSYSINIAQTGSRGVLQGIRIFEFDGDGRMVRRITAESGVVDARSDWQLAGVTLTMWPAPRSQDAAASAPRVQQQSLDRWVWHSNLSVGVVAAAVLPLSTMSTLELRRYIGHLADNEQAAQRYEIQFWKRALYPFACLVMVALALPFAYLHARAGGISLKVFGGIMLGITFVLLNNLAGHLGLLHQWTPWLVAAAPSALFLLMSLAAFAWLVRYR